MIVSPFRQKVESRGALLGTFVKIPAIASVEALAEAALDFVVLDQEHAAFDRAALDTLLFAATALRLPALVRVSHNAPFAMHAALDAGAAGVLVPHVDSLASAQGAARACRYAGGRGYSGAARSARGFTGLRDAVDHADRNVLVIAQIEDVSGVEAADAIAAVDGIDGLFIGRADLAVDMGADSSDDDRVWQATRRIASAARAWGKALAGFAASPAETGRLTELGATMIVQGSDQAWLGAAARAAAGAVRR